MVKLGYFIQALLPSNNEQQPATINHDGNQATTYYEDDDDEDENSLLNRVPEDTTVLQDCITASQGCLLLLVLKQHLKDLYGISDA